MTDKLTDAELDFLTPEERAALAEDAPAAESQAAPPDAADASQSETADAEPDADTKPGAEAEEKRKSTEQEGEYIVPAVPLLKGGIPDNVEQTLAQLRERKAALVQKFDDGDLSSRDYTDQLEAINDEVEVVKQAVFKDRLAREMTQQQAEQVWRSDVTDFLADHPEVHRNEITWGAFDLAVRAVTAASENSGLSNRQQLAKAHAVWAEQLGIAPAAKAREPQAPAQAPAPAAPKTERKVPPTLARIPASDTQATDEGKWSALDRLAATDPDAYEQRLARLAPAELAEYERASG